MKKLYFLIAIFLFTSCTDDDKIAGKNDPEIPPSNILDVGQSSRELLSGQYFENLIVEIQYPAGFALPSGTLNDLKSFLDKHIEKPGGIQFIEEEIAVAANNQYSINEVREVEKNHRTAYNSSNTMAIYLFLANGDYEENESNSKVLGAAYRNTSMVLFQKTIQDLSGGLGKPTERLVTSTVLNHEVGHLLGLVNLGTPMATEHQDEAHGHHCDNTNCLMYWTAETGNVIDNLLGVSSPPDLDAQCIADLALLREE